MWEDNAISHAECEAIKPSNLDSLAFYIIIVNRNGGHSQGGRGGTASLQGEAGGPPPPPPKKPCNDFCHFWIVLSIGTIFGNP